MVKKINLIETLLIISMSILSSCKKDKFTETYQRIPEAFAGINGELIDFIWNGDTITCEKINNYYIYEGDIILTEDQLKLLSDSKGTAILPFTYRWENGIVYYSVSATINFSDLIGQAIKEYEDQTKVKFIKRTNETDYVEFILSPDGNASNIGMQGGKQEIWLADWAEKRDIIHEIGHTIGLGHEHTRWDRNDYVDIHMDNIMENQRHYFYRSIYLFNTAEFDFSSVMLYPSFTGYEIDVSKPSITKVDGSVYSVSWESLSQGDIEMINRLYGLEKPEAAFAISSSNTELYTPIQFTDYSINNPTIWLWNFGDGTVSNEQNPEHIYKKVGTFSISLHVQNGYGASNTIKKDILKVDYGEKFISEGLIAYYPFSGNANDGSQNGNNGLVYGASLTTDRFGNGNNAYLFDGVDDFIRIPYSVSLEPSNPITFMAWIFPTALTMSVHGNYYAIISHSEFNAEMYTLGVDSMFIRLGNMGFNNSEFGKIPLNKWSLITGGIKDNDRIFGYDTLYYGGSDPSPIWSDGNIHDLYIGSSEYSRLFNFKGKIDDIRIYNRLLSQDEIKYFYYMKNKK